MINYILTKNLVKLVIAQDNYINLLIKASNCGWDDESVELGARLRNEIDYLKYKVDWKGNYVKKN